MKLLLLLFVPSIIYGQIVTFPVDDVKINNKLLPETQAKIALEGKLEQAVLTMHNPKENIVAMNHNAFLSTIHTAYDQHRPLSISPDDIWLLITQGICIHVNKNYDKLKTQLLKSTMQREIVIKDSNLISFQSKDWRQLIAGLSDSVQQYTTTAYHELMIDSFSTSTPKNTTALEITLLESVEKTFSYIGETGCGIPHIHLLGTKEDWLKIKVKLKSLDLVGMEYWAKELYPIIDEFIHVYNGNVNTRFWQKLYKDVTLYNEYYISGWVVKLFPYIKEEQQVKPMRLSKGGYPITEIDYYPNPFLKGEKYHCSTLTTEDFLEGISSIDFTLRIVSPRTQDTTLKELKIVAGFIGAKQFQNKEIGPYISWAVLDANLSKPKATISYEDEQTHQGERIYPNLQTKAYRRPIFNPSKNKTYNQGIEELKTIVKKQILKQNPKAKGNLRLHFVVTWDATVSSTTIEYSNETMGTKQELLDLFNSIPKSFSKPYSFYKPMFEEGKKSYYINYPITLNVSFDE